MRTAGPYGAPEIFSPWMGRALVLSLHVRIDHVGRYELCVCRRCGHTDWYTREVEASSARPHVWMDDVRERPCRDCAATEVWQVPVVKLVRRGSLFPMAIASGGSSDESGRTTSFETVACKGCGLTTWRYRTKELARGHGRAPCAECGAAEGLEVTNTPYSLWRTLRWGIPRSRGPLSLTICHRCRHVKWTARELEHLAEAKHRGIELVEAPNDGPYR